jgi:hypothetical protein
MIRLMAEIDAVDKDLPPPGFSLHPNFNLNLERAN